MSRREEREFANRRAVSNVYMKMQIFFTSRKVDEAFSEAELFLTALHGASREDAQRRHKRI